MTQSCPEPLFGHDTSPEVARLIIEGLRAMTPEQKLRRVFDLNRTLELLQEARIRAQYGPAIPEREVRLRLAALRLGRDLMIRAFGWDPEVEGW